MYMVGPQIKSCTEVKFPQPVEANNSAAITLPGFAEVPVIILKYQISVALEAAQSFPQLFHAEGSDAKHFGFTSSFFKIAIGFSQMIQSFEYIFAQNPASGAERFPFAANHSLPGCKENASKSY